MGVGMYLFVSGFCRTSLQQGLKPQRFFVALNSFRGFDESKNIMNKYSIALFLLLGLLLYASAQFLNFNLKWFYFIIILLISYICGKVIRSTKDGFNIKSLVFQNITELKQSFTVEIISDFKGNSIIILGNFNNEQQLSENDLRILLLKVSRTTIIKALKTGNSKTISFSYNGYPVFVEFEKILSF